jgi:acylphosphatase
MVSYNFLISGKVQGVYYRKSVSEKLNKFGVSGYVKNLPNGNVEAEITFEEFSYDEVLHILKEGSEYSRVDYIKPLKIDKIYEDGFKVES